MRPRVQSIVDKVVSLLPWANKERTLVVDLAAKVGHVEDSEVHGLVHCRSAVAAPVCTREDGCGAIRKTSTTVGTRKGKIHVDSGCGHFVAEPAWAVGSAAGVHVYRVIAVEWISSRTSITAVLGDMRRKEQEGYFERKTRILFSWMEL